MKVVELFQVLQNIISDGKGEYIIFDEGYMNEIETENIAIDDKKGRVYTIKELKKK